MRVLVSLVECPCSPCTSFKVTPKHDYRPLLLFLATHGHLRRRSQWPFRPDTRLVPAVPLPSFRHSISHWRGISWLFISCALKCHFNSSKAVPTPRRPTPDCCPRLEDALVPRAFASSAQNGIFSVDGQTKKTEGSKKKKRKNLQWQHKSVHRDSFICLAWCCCFACAQHSFSEVPLFDVEIARLGVLECQTSLWSPWRSSGACDETVQGRLSERVPSDLFRLGRKTHESQNFGPI